MGVGVKDKVVIAPFLELDPLPISSSLSSDEFLEIADSVF